MATLPEGLGWVSGIRQLETTDPVEAGAGGIANQQATELASRTKFLKDYIDNTIMPLLTPITSGLGNIWWDGAVASIPAGWGEDINMRGRVPVGKTNGTDSQFDTMGNTGGVKAVTLSAANMPKQNVTSLGTAGTDAGDGFVTTGNQTLPPSVIGTTGNDSPTSIAVMNPYRVGMWIRWVGIGNGING